MVIIVDSIVCFISTAINDICLHEGCGTAIPNLECRKAVDGVWKCLCKAGYKENTQSATCEERGMSTESYSHIVLGP